MNNGSYCIYLTGGSGQIGSSVRKIFHRKRIKVVLLTRSYLKPFSNETLKEYQLGDSASINCKNEHSILIHLAHDYSDSRIGPENINTKGLRFLLASFENFRSFRTVFLSTPIKKDLRNTLYQEQKWLGEKICAKRNSIILKPSFVFSKDKGVNRIFYFLSKYGIPIPLPKVDSRLAPILAADLAKLICSDKILEKTEGSYLVIGKEKMRLDQFLTRYHGLKSFYLPNFVVRIIIRMLSLINVNFCFYLKERVLGLTYLIDIDELGSNEKEIVI
jgi:hypothetical protein